MCKLKIFEFNRYLLYFYKSIHSVFEWKIVYNGLKRALAVSQAVVKKGIFYWKLLHMTSELRKRDLVGSLTVNFQRFCCRESQVVKTKTTNWILVRVRMGIAFTWLLKVQILYFVLVYLDCIPVFLTMT